jgi:hypothetical protein
MLAGGSRTRGRWRRATEGRKFRGRRSADSAAEDLPKRGENGRPGRRPAVGGGGQGAERDVTLTKEG